MAKGSAPEIMASPTPISEFRKLKMLPPPIGIWTLLSKTYNGASEAMLGSINTIIMPSIMTCLPENLNRENEYAANTPISTDNAETLAANAKLLRARVQKLTGLLVG